MNMKRIMKKIKIIQKIIFVLLFVFIIGSLGGCTSDDDVRTYLQALLDASYKNDSTAFLKMKLGTEEEAQALYERGVKTGTDAFCAKLNVPEELRDDFQKMYENMLSKVRYTIGKAEKQSDGSYNVTVSYERMNVFVPAIETYQIKAAELAQKWMEEDNVPGEDEMETEVLHILRESMDTVLADVQYDEPAEMTVRIELVNNVYTPNLDDVAALENALFDTEKE